MIYQKFGDTGVTTSKLGFGAMRLPMKEINGKKVIDDDLAIPLMRRAFELGVNYIDTAPYYCDSLSEGAVGRALKGYRDKIYLSTKNPIEDLSAANWLKRLEKSLKNLDVDYIDFYHFWGINLSDYREWEATKDGPFDGARRALDEGLIKKLSFSFHDGPENMPEIIDGGRFSSVLMQYNLLDRSNEENLAYARKKGLGTVVMGPVGGGRLGAPSDVIKSLLPTPPKSSAEMALRFVLANPNVDVALSGMSNLAQLEENAVIANNPERLTNAELDSVKTMLEENKRLAELYCTGCQYCMPCPQGINIPHIFGIMNNHRVYKITDFARSQYKEVIEGTGWTKSADASKCVECGECESKCPQKLAIIQQLKETHAALS